MRCFASVFIGLLLAASALADVPSDIRALTGARTRIAWCRDAGDGTDPFANGESLRLVGIDTDDGRGERVILGQPSGYAKPLITPDSAEQTGPARIISFSSDASTRNFTLGQHGDRLVLRLRTPFTGPNGTNPEVEIFPVAAGKPHHVILAYMPDLLVGYLDGRQVLVSTRVQGDFGNWAPGQRLLFGDEWTGGRDWAGSLEGVAIYSRFIDMPEAEQHYAAFAPRLNGRKSVPRIAVEAKLIAVTPTPAVKDIQPYRRALVEYAYDVTKVLDGRCDAKRILVAHWAIMDAQPIPLGRKLGDVCRLLIERMADNPQLESERRIVNEGYVEVPVYYESK